MSSGVSSVENPKEASIYNFYDWKWRNCWYLILTKIRFLLDTNFIYFALCFAYTLSGQSGRSQWGIFLWFLSLSVLFILSLLNRLLKTWRPLFHILSADIAYTIKIWNLLMEEALQSYGLFAGFQTIAQHITKWLTLLQKSNFERLW